VVKRRHPIIATRRVYVGVRIPKGQALHLARLKSPGDYRSFKYDPVTGWATLT